MAKQLCPLPGRGGQRDRYERARLSAEYKRKLAVLDQKFHITPDNQTGSLVNRILS